VISDSAVTSFDYEIIGEGVGVLGQLARIRLKYDAPEVGAPASLVAKFPATVQQNRDLANLFPLLRTRSALLRGDRRRG
jgi:hypothetical protein